jgi:hypothetical protein
MQFKDWIGSEISEPYDAYDFFINSVISEDSSLMECDCNAIELMGEFVLEEASTPWKTKDEDNDEEEDWLDSTNQKIASTSNVKAFTKNGKKLVFEPFIINLLPANQSGINLCMCATKHCAATCLHTAGSVQFLINKTLGRLRKTWFLALDRNKAFRQIVGQIQAKKNSIDKKNAKSKKEYHQMIVRLNGTSDLIWRVLTGEGGKNIFDMFPDIKFYDYSKDQSEMDNFIRGEIVDEDGQNLGKFPPNYHLTLSYGGLGGNVENYKRTLEAGENLAVPFGPGKTAGKDYQKFPKMIEHLIRAPTKGGFRDRIYFPDHIKTTSERSNYFDMVIEKIKQDGDYVSPEELAPFAGQTLLPGLFMCHEVVSGDEYDARFLDDFLLARANRPQGDEDQSEMEIDEINRSRKQHGLVIGLTAKGDLSFSAYKGSQGWDHKHTGFMVGPEDREINAPCRPRLNDPSKESLLRKKTEVYKKVARAVMTIRNFDARHVHAQDKDEQGVSRTEIFKTKGSKKGAMTYIAAKGRTTKEMNELIGVIQAVMKGEESQTQTVNKLRAGQDLAKKLRGYLMNPEIREMLNNPDFQKEARKFGMNVNFESLAKLADMDVRRDPLGPKRTLLPNDMLKSLSAPND